MGYSQRELLSICRTTKLPCGTLDIESGNCSRPRSRFYRSDELPTLPAPPFLEEQTPELPCICQAGGSHETIWCTRNGPLTGKRLEPPLLRRTDWTQSSPPCAKRTCASHPEPSSRSALVDPKMNYLTRTKEVLWHFGHGGKVSV